ncbi:hypothetical protein [Sphingomonas sp. OTU376]|uniref:hypothetical protein n=1 Tax=Sphingomonas sp. OTU376 TaxID=3043863 RepID=UPI00313EA9BF
MNEPLFNSLLLPTIALGLPLGASMDAPRPVSAESQSSRKAVCAEVSIAINGRSAAVHIRTQSAPSTGETRIELPLRAPRQSVFFGFDAALRRSVLDRAIPLESARARSIYTQEVGSGNAAAVAASEPSDSMIAQVQSPGRQDPTKVIFHFVSPVDPVQGLVLTPNSRSLRNCGVFVSASKYQVLPTVAVGGRRLEFKSGPSGWQARLKGDDLPLAGDISVTGGTLARQAWISWSDIDDAGQMVNPTFFVADNVLSGDLGAKPRPTVTAVTDGSGRRIAYRVVTAAGGRWSLVGPAPASNRVRVALSDGSSQTYTLDYDAFPNFGPGIFWARPLVDDLMRSPARRAEGLDLALRYRMLGPHMSYLLLQKLGQYRRAGLQPPPDVERDAERENEVPSREPPKSPPVPKRPSS